MKKSFLMTVFVLLMILSISCGAFAAGILDSADTNFGKLTLLGNEQTPDPSTQVRVIVENTTYSIADGAPWDGTLVDTWVNVDNSSTMMSCVVAALGSYTQTGAESNYISEINGLEAFDGGDMSGWMGTLNDWFTNEGFGAFTVADGKLKAGDEIRIMYTCDFGEDLGGSWGNSDTTVKAVAFSAGTLNKTFSKDENAYTLTVPGGTTGIKVTPTASNKNYQVRTYVGDTEYARTATVPVANGTVITVKCGDPSWPSMNSSTGAKTYTFTVAYEITPIKVKVAPSTASVSLFTDAACENPVAEGSISAGEVNGKYNEFTVSLPEGTYYYKGTDGETDLGSGCITIGRSDIVLVRHNFYTTNGAFASVGDWMLSDFTDKTDSNDTKAYTLGAGYMNGARPYVSALLIGGHKYGSSLAIAEQFEDDYYLGAWNDFTVSATSTGAVLKSLPINAYKSFTLIAPSNADKVEFFEQKANFRVEKLDTADMTATVNDDGTTTYRFKSKTVNYAFQHMWRVTKAGKTTLAGYMKNNATITTDWSEYQPTDTANHPKDAGFNYDDNSVLLNIDDTKDTNELAMQVGETFKLRAFRNGWEIISDVSGNKMIEPDFHYSILSGDDVVSVAPVTDAVTGNASGNWMNIEAEKAGMAVIAVWYDGIDIKGSAQFDGFYGATNPARYGYVVVNVGEDETVDISPVSADGDWDAEFDTVYYADENGGTFSFTSEDATGVTVANLCGATMGEAQIVTKDASGKWNVPVFNGSNLITVTSDDGVDYYLVRAKKVNADITNVTTGKTNADEDFVINLGDTVSVSLDRLDMPLPKMSGLYNPGFGGTCKMVYMINGKYCQVSKGTQYNFPTPKVCTVTFVASVPGELNLGDGYITTGVFGSAPGAHRGITDAGVPVNTNAPENSYCFGKLPELTLHIEDGEPLSYEDVTELTSLNIYSGAFTGMSTTKYFEFTSAADTGAYWKNSPNAKAYLSVTAVPKCYYNTMNLTYWYEGEAPKTVDVPSNNELRIPVGDDWKVDSAKMLNLVFTITPGDGNTEKALSYHYLVMGGITKLTFVHPVISGLTVTDSENNELSFTSPFNLNDTDYTLKVGNAETVNLNASMLQRIVSATANSNDKADTVSVQLFAEGVALGDAVTVAPADENAYPVGSWSLSDLNIKDADQMKIKVVSYANDSVFRTYNIALNKNTNAWEGSGTEADPYLLSNGADLSVLSEKSASETFANTYFKFANDIFLPGEWTPIGTNGSRFAGHIDGDGHTLTVPAGEKAMLGYTKDATLKNLDIYGKKIDGNGVVAFYSTGATNITCATIENVTLKAGTKTTGSGFISGYASGSYPVIIRNCTVEKDVVCGCDGDKSNVGSFGGDFNGTIVGCVSHGTVKGVNYVGGICGNKGQTMGDFVIADCIFDGTVIATGSNVGGIAGAGYGGTSFGLASAPNTPCATVTNCLCSGDITGLDHVGGILGAEPGVKECWNNGLGYVQANLFTGSVVATLAEGTPAVGGILGYLSSINNMNIISGNYYKENGDLKGIGVIDMVETHESSGTFGEGWNKYTLSGMKYGRTDDPAGTDADKLAKACTAEELGDGTVVNALNSARNSSGNWVQGDSSPVFKAYDGKHLIRMVCTALNTSGGVSQEVYGSDVLEGKTVTLIFNDGSEKQIRATDSTVTKDYEVTPALKGSFIPASILYDGHELVFNLNIKNTKPVIADGVGKSVKQNAVLNKACAIDLNGVFTDADGDALTYTVKIGSAKKYVAAEVVDGIYSYTPTEASEIELRFKANDGTDDSSEYYTVKLNVKSDNTAVTSVTVADVVAVAGAGRSFTVTLPFGTELTKDSFAIVLADANAVVSEEPALEEGVWNFTVKAQNGTEKTYYVKVSYEDDPAVLSVVEMINGLGEITLEKANDIVEARAAFDNLSEAQQDKIAASVYRKLAAAEKTYAELKAAADKQAADAAAAKAVEDKISAIGTVTPDSKDAIEAARAAYDALTDDQKALVPNYNTLTDAEAAYAELSKEKELPFKDITNHWAKDAIDYMYQAGLMNGVSATEFAPNALLTRGMFVAILYRIEGSPDVSGVSGFSDVSADKYYSNAVIWAKSTGVVSGTSKTTFSPNDNVTREQMVTILYRYARYCGEDVSAKADFSGYTDASQISSYAMDAMAWAKAKGYISGRTATTLVPKGTATRAEVATVLMKYLSVE